jgi:hypothetical protein
MVLSEEKAPCGYRIKLFLEKDDSDDGVTFLFEATGD